jgi:phage tail sheath protein FI
MAITTPSQSPAITVREVDLTGVVPNITTSTGVFVGDFSWGPVREPTLISQEKELASTFGTPTTSNNIDYMSAANFLRYSNSLYVIRESTVAGLNASDSAGAAIQIRNKDHFDTLSLTLGGQDFIARYPGTHGNSIKVEYSKEGGSTNFSAAALEQFDSASGTSEVHVLITDEDGVISGTAGTVLERHAFLSTVVGNKTSDGSTNYYKDVINQASDWVYVVDTTLDSSKAISFAGGANSATLTPTEYASGFDDIENTETYPSVDLLIAPGMASRADQATVVNDLTSIAGTTRKDCVVIASPTRSDIITNSGPVSASNAVSAAVDTGNTFTSSSYLVYDNNYLKVYDKYNDSYVWIPAASGTAGTMAATDAVAAPWFSPAGERRGQVLGVTSLAYNANKSQRDSLYKAAINPIVNIPGQGVILFGDKTKLTRPSAFDRINVRRLFLAIERAIAIAARNVMFEFNDEFSRAEFVNVVEPFLREIKGRRGITDFRVLCDESNNTAAVVDRNEFIASIFIKPARSINFVTLNFVAVRTGVDFEEVSGTV